MSYLKGQTHGEEKTTPEIEQKVAICCHYGPGGEKNSDSKEGSLLKKVDKLTFND